MFNLLKKREVEILPPPPPFPSLDESDESKNELDKIEEFKLPEMNEAEEEINQAVNKLKQQSFWKRLFKSKGSKNKDEEHKEIGLKPEIDGVSAIQNLVKSSRDALLEFNLEKARKLYIEANEMYSQLPPEEQAKVYNEIKDLYDERKSAEALKLN